MKVSKIAVSILLTLSLLITPINPLNATTVAEENDHATDTTNSSGNIEENQTTIENDGNEDMNSPGVEETVEESENQDDIEINSESNVTKKSQVNTLSAVKEYKEGDSNKEIAEYKEKLNRLGFKVTISNNYDKEMTQAVKRFQEYYGLKQVNGILNIATMEKIDELINSPFQNGKRHPDTVKLKEDLAFIGFGIPDSQYTTLYAAKTEASVKSFQEYYGLVVNGIADDVTLRKIAEIRNTPLQKGKSHPDTVQLKKDLAFLGFPVPGNGTAYYGEKTKTKVEEFQRKYKLVVNGIADPVTLAKIDELKNAPLSIGMRREDVKTLKQYLAKLGFAVPGNGTNYFGKKTEQKVKEFQKYYGLKITGVVDKETFDKLNKNANTPLQKGKNHSDTISLKENLATLGFGVKNSQNTTYFGTKTESSVKSFQKYYGLVVNGIADEVTLRKINEILNSPLQKDRRHEDTITLKKNLERLGFGVPGSQYTTLYGKKTKAQVEAFQEHYNLVVNGIADEVTLKKINEILNSPLQEGKRHSRTIQLKKDLEDLGYGVPGSEYTNYYGPKTAEMVKKFQKDHGLPVSGIADEITLAKIEELLKNNNNNNNKPKIITEYTDYKITFEKALDIQMQQLNLTDKHRNKDAYIRSNYLRYIGTGKIITSSSASLVNVRSKPSTKSTSVAKLKNGATIQITGYVDNGEQYKGSSTWYKIRYNNQTRYVHSAFVQANQAIAIERVNVRLGQGTSYPIIGTIGTDSSERVTIVNHGTTWHQIKPNWIRPTRSELAEYLDPNKNDKFQHLRLDKSIGVTASQLNKVLNNKGILDKKGKYFIEAGQKYNLNEAYLIAHALLETGNGTSQLANGVEVGLNNKGEPVRVTASNRNSLKSIKKTYNMYGIGAVDGKAVTAGAIRAYKEGWFTPEKAIVEGAKWINNGYIHNEHGQNTLYKMKWNPRMGDGYQWKQYATDIGWPTKQVRRIKEVYDQLDNPTYHYDIPKYR